MKKGLILAALFVGLGCFAAEDKASDAKSKDEDKDKDKPKPFAEVIKDTQAVPGFFTLYRKEDTVLLEIRPEQLDRKFLCSPTLESGLGERSLLSAQMLSEFVFTLHRVGKR